MLITFSFNKNLDLTREEEKFIYEKSASFGQVEVSNYSSKAGAIDLVTIVEAAITLYISKSVNAFVKGFIGEDWYEKQGEQTRRLIKRELINAKYFIRAFYDCFIKNKENTQEALVVSEHIGDVTLYVVINHYKMSKELLDNLPEALVKTYGNISLSYIKVDSKICQLYPDFQNNEWRYLFTPTHKGFGNYVDEYYDFTLNKVFQIKSKEEFIEKFVLLDEDKFKIIVNPLIDR